LAKLFQYFFYFTCNHNLSEEAQTQVEARLDYGLVHGRQMREAFFVP